MLSLIGNLEIFWVKNTATRMGRVFVVYDQWVVGFRGVGVFGEVCGDVGASLGLAADRSRVYGHARGAAHEVNEEVDAVPRRRGLDPCHEIRQWSLEDFDLIAGGKRGGREFHAGGEAGAQGGHQVWWDDGGLWSQ